MSTTYFPTTDGRSDSQTAQKIGEQIDAEFETAKQAVAGQAASLQAAADKLQAGVLKSKQDLTHRLDACVERGQRLGNLEPSTASRAWRAS